MKPVRLLKKAAATTAAGLLALGIVAGTASAASADDYVTAGGNAGELSRFQPGNAGELSSLGGNAGELSSLGGNAGELSSLGGNAGELSGVVTANNAGELS